MRKIYKILLAIFVVGSISLTASAQQEYWSSRTDNAGITTDKAVARQSFPKEFKLFNLNIDPLRQTLMSVVDRPGGPTAIISIPNASGELEQFEVFEASNFEPELQARFPEIRAFSGKGITDKSATLKLSISPQGIQTMVFRTATANEFIEPYSQDHTVYAVFRSQRNKGSLPWTCSTQDQQMFSGLNQAISGRIESNAGQLKTMRLAQSCNGEYANFFGATSAAQVGLVLAAYNATLTRCNGTYEKDLALHLNLVSESVNVIFYDPATDPYTTLANWNTQLQQTLNTTLTGPGTPLAVNNAAYDIGHMFGASGGGGNAGCIGCVCVDGVPSGTGATKGRGITSPADGIPQGDNFDIDYVAHEIGHQLGANHTFSFQSEGTGVNKEVASGVTIMGYAGIVAGLNVDDHSIDVWHQASIQQIQTNLATKTCPITTSLSGINATPVVAALTNYTIPISTPFALTGSATDADAGDVLTYCWEQNDDISGQTGANSTARENKPVGPNWLTYPATTSPTRLMPRLSTILVGSNLTGPNPGGSAGISVEALSNVNRTLNFRLTVRDNRPYNGTAVGQTNFQDMVVTVNNTGGPFLITSQNSAVTYDAGTTQTVTWSVNNTTAAPFNCANVKISFSTDGGVTFPTVLAASTANDGSEAVVLPSTLTTQGRIKVEAIGNIFFDINNANITLAAPPVGFSFGPTTPATATCPAPATMNVTLPVNSNGGYVQPVTLSATAGVPAGTTITFGTNPVVPGNSSVVTLNNANTLSAGTYNVTIQGTGPAPAVTQTTTVTFTVNAGTGPVITTQPTNQTTCSGNNATFNVTATGVTGYQWQVSTTGCGGTFSNISGATSSSYTVTAPTTTQNGYGYRCVLTGQCGTTTSSCATLTVNVPPSITSQPSNIAVCSGSSASFTVAATGSGIGYQWEISTNSGGTWTPVPGATSSTYTIASTTTTMNGDQYRCVVTGLCPPAATSNAATLTVNSSVTVTGNPSNSTICEGTGTSFTASASGSGLNYQWEVSTNGGSTWSNVVNGPNYSGATTPTLTLINTPPTFNNNRYRCNITSPPCTPGITTAAILTVNTFPVITAQPTNQTICEGGNPTFSVTATTAVGSLTYQWQVSTDNGATWSNLVGATTNTFSQTNIPVGQNGYRFRVIVTAGCGSSTSNAATITVNAFPVVSLTNLPTTLCLSDPTYALTASLGGGVWSGPGVTGSNFSPTAAGLGTKTISYAVSNAGCVTTRTSIVQVNECAERHLRLYQYPAVVVYPNPTSGNFSLRVNTDMYSNIGIKVFNSMGQVMLTRQFSGVTYGSVLPMNITNFHNGVYHLMIYSTDLGKADTKGVSIILTK